MNWVQKNLRFGGTCTNCQKSISVREQGWHNAELKVVRCNQCGPENRREPEATDGIFQFTPTSQVAGSAALREFDRRRDHKWVKGAAGEYQLDEFLYKNIHQGAVLLSDRVIPGTKSNIDHIVISKTGIWIIDAKNWSGKIEVRPESAWKFEPHLYVNGRDRTSAVENMYRQIIPVRQALDDRQIPIHAVLLLINGDWGFSTVLRAVLQKPYVIQNVVVTWQRNLVKLINESGHPQNSPLELLGDKDIRSFAEILDINFKGA